MIIVFGEGVTSVIVGLDDFKWNLETITVAALSFLIVVSIWKLYFYNSDSDDITKAKKMDGYNMYKTFVYGVYIAINGTIFP